ncbi:MAG TPA: hypothetical protein PLJ34_00505, partial [Hyphomicrobiales bacterium]|nr:hypothetical protein [Hyphomicrobiales bacterium]
MVQSARVLVIDEKVSDERSRFWNDLDRFGFHATTCAPDEALRIGSRERPDVIVVDARDGAAADEVIASRLAGGDGALPPAILFLADEGDDTATRTKGLGHVLYPPLEPGRLAHSLATLLRQNALQQEIDRRVRAAERVGATPIAPPPATGAAGTASVLVVGVGRTFLKIESSLSSFAEVFGALTLDQAEDCLASASFDAVVIEPSIDFDHALVFAAQLRRNPRLATLPVVMLLDPHFMMGLREAYAAGVTDVLPTSFAADDFAVRMAVHAGEVQAHRDLHAAVRALRAPAGDNPAPRLEDADYLAAYLDIAAGQAAAAVGSLHLATITIADIAAIEAAHGPAVVAAAREQVVRILDRLVRAEN